VDKFEDLMVKDVKKVGFYRIDKLIDEVCSFRLVNFPAYRQTIEEKEIKTRAN